jgi:hypothetical protein
MYSTQVRALNFHQYVRTCMDYIELRPIMINIDVLYG